MNQQNKFSIFLLSLICVAAFSSCREKLSPATIATLTASRYTLVRSNDNLDYSCRRLHRMLEAERKNDLEKMDMFLSMDSLVNVYAAPLDTLLVKLIDEIQYSEKHSEEYVSDDFIKKIENGNLLKRKLSMIKSAIAVVTAKFPLSDTIPIDRDTINRKCVYLELFSHTASKLEAVTMLTVLRNNIKSTRMMLLSRFVKEINDELWWVREQLFLTCNYSHLKVGDTLQASFALGEYCALMDEDIYIDGKIVSTQSQKASYSTYIRSDIQKPMILSKQVYKEVVRSPGRYVRSVVAKIPSRSGKINEIKDSLVYTVEP